MIHSTHSATPDRAPSAGRVVARRAEAKVRTLDYLTERPLLVLGALVAAFLAWVVYDASAPQPHPKPAPAGAQQLESPMSAELVRMRAVGMGLRAVHEGMSRAEVESRLGRPSPRDIRPVERANGRVVYRTHYPAFLTQSLSVAPNVDGYCEAILEYDAAAPGHPLLSITAVPRAAPGAVISTSVA